MKPDFASTRLLLVPAVVCIAALFPAAGQRMVLGGLTGRVQTSSGAPVSRTAVTAYGPFSSATTRTDDTGAFSFAQLAEGRYSIRLISRTLCQDQPAEITVLRGKTIALPAPVVASPCDAKQQPKVPGPKSAGSESTDRCRPSRGEPFLAWASYLAAVNKQSIVLCQEGRELSELIGHTGRITALDFSRDSRFLASGSDDRTARIWDITAGRLSRVLRHERGVTRVRFAPDTRYLASADDAASVYLWDLAGGKMVNGSAVLAIPPGWDLGFPQEGPGVRVYHTLLYGPGEITLGPREQEDLARQAERLKELLARFPGLAVKIEAHSDPVTEGRNGESISRGRGEGVRSLIQSAGIPARATNVVSFGALRPECKGKPGERCDELNRRVVLAAEFRVRLATAY